MKQWFKIKFWRMVNHEHQFDIWRVCKKCKRHKDDIKAKDNHMIGYA